VQPGAIPSSIAALGGGIAAPGQTVQVGFDAIRSGRTYVLFDPDHIKQGYIVHFVAS
jgi:hypothetical protein